MKHLDLFLSSTPLKSILCIVAETHGSCPGRVGFKMIVPPDGACIGSVGGGAMEHKVIQAARDMLACGEEKPVILPFNHTSIGEPQERSGMVCSGNQKIILIPSSNSKQPLDGKLGILVSENGLLLLDNSPGSNKLHISGDSWEYTEELTPPPVVYIFGGGHCSLALTPVLNSLDMRVVIIDDREHVWTMEENTTAWKKIVLSYDEAASLVPEESNAIVVIMSASHGGDSAILRQMLPKKLRYLGMMGSRATGKHILAEMKSLGFTNEDIGRVHTPIGISISSQTPAEIAVSIAAEIIMVLNGKSQ